MQIIRQNKKNTNQGEELIKILADNNQTTAEHSVV